MGTDVDQELWRDPGASVAERVKDLMSKMTIEEKTGQLYGLWLGVDEQTVRWRHTRATWDGRQRVEGVLARGVGQLTRPYGTAPVEPVVGAQALARAQGEIMARAARHTCARARGVPYRRVGVEGAVYPSPLCWGATFDPELIERLGAHIGQLMRRLGVHQGLAPVLDVVRDLRWGRTEETIGEDPYLVGTIGSAYVEVSSRPAWSPL